MPKHYEYLSNGIVYGPVTGKEVRRLAASGQIGPDDLIRTVGTEGSGNWVRAGKVKDLHFTEVLPVSTEPPPANGEPAAPSQPAHADALPNSVPHCPSDARPGPDPFAEMEADPCRPAHLRRGRGVAAREYALAALYSFLGFLWAWTVGFASAVMIYKGQYRQPELTMLSTGLGCLLILFASIILRSFRVRLWVGVLLLIFPCLGISLLRLAV